MTKHMARVADVVSRSHSIPQNIELRIERRLEVLREWLSEGIPMGKVVPASLRAAREWNDPELGITPIVSPNEFTTTHHRHGGLVRDVAGLLNALRSKFRRPASQSVSRRPELKAKLDRKDFDRQIQALVSQWHSERDQRLYEKRRADAAEARSVMLINENREKDDLISDLRRQLAAQQGLRVVE